MADDAHEDPSSSREPAGPWPMARRGAGRTGHAPDVRGPTDRVTQRWHVAVPGGVRALALVEDTL